MVVVIYLIGMGNSLLDVGRMLGIDIGDFVEIFVSFVGKFFGVLFGGDIVEIVIFGDGDNVNYFVFFEDGVDGDGFFEEVVVEFDFVGDGVIVDLDFYEVGFFLFEGGFVDLGVGKNVDDGVVFFDVFEFVGDGGIVVFGVFFGVFGESFFFGFVLVFVEVVFDFIG